MSKLKTNTIRHVDGSNDNITLDSSQNVTVEGNLNLSDTKKINVGTDQDLQVYHSGSHSYIDDTGTGQLIIKSDLVKLQATNGEDYLQGHEDGQVELYHNGTKKFSTIQYGIEVHGTTDNARIAFSDAYANSRIGYVGLNRFGIDAHDGLEVRDPSDSYGTRFKIDSNGYITKPAQPYAKLHFNGGSEGGVDSTSLTKQDSVSASTIRNGMSHTTGRITVPIAGAYLIYAHNNNYEEADAHMSVRVNGSTIDGGNAQNGDATLQWKSMSIMTVLDLSASDYVESWLDGKQDNKTWNSLIVTLLS